MRRNGTGNWAWALCVALAALAGVGCHSNSMLERAGFDDDDAVPVAMSMPRELSKVSLPPHVIEPPDILLIEATHNLRRPDAPLRPGDGLLVQIGRGLPVDPAEEPLLQQFKEVNGVVAVGTDGRLDLGPVYGTVFVLGMTVDGARQAIADHLGEKLNDVVLHVTMPQPEGGQLVFGEHLVRPDGSVALGIYGSVYVAGMTLDQARCAVEAHLAQWIVAPEVSVDVLGYNSKVYYIVTDNAGAGEQVFRFPCTGNETVLDALSQINGLPVVASKKDIWIARPAPPEVGCDQVLPVDWDAIVQGGATGTNYQVLPGDRIYVRADHWFTFDTAVAKLTAPLERVAGFALLGNGTVRAIQYGHRFGGGFGGGGFGGTGF